MDSDNSPEPYCVDLFTRSHEWSELFGRSAALAGVEVRCHGEARVTSWPPCESCQLAVLDYGTVDCAQVSVGVGAGNASPGLVWLGGWDGAPALPPEVSSCVLDWVEGQPAPDWLARRLRLWQHGAALLTQLAASRGQLGETVVQNDLLTGRLKRLEEWIDLLNRQRVSMGSVMEKFNMLSRLGQQINTLDVQRIAQICVEKIPLLIDARYASLYLYDPGTDELVLARHNCDADIAERVHLAGTPNCVMAEAVQRKEVLLIKRFDSYEKMHGVQFIRPNHDRYQSNSCLVAPLMSADRLVGVLNFSDKSTADFFDEINDLPTVEHLSHLIAAAIRNCQLFQEVRRQARCDSMTGFLNHRTFLEELQEEIRRCARYGEEPSVIMIDCDRFKSINDTYGHLAGDQVIKDVASIIEANVRDVDKPCRYGGDEFAVLLINSSESTAEGVAQRILQATREHHVLYGDMDAQITLSVGIAHYAAGRSADELVHAADEALYDAKNCGRNRISCHTMAPAPDESEANPSAA